MHKKSSYITPKPLTPGQQALQLKKHQETLQQQRLELEEQRQRIDGYGIELERIRKQSEQDALANKLSYNALENHINLLANFAGHDIKNALHNMDGVVSLLSVENVTVEDILNIKECTNRIRAALNDFESLGLPQNTNVVEPFEIIRLMTSLNVLHRRNFSRESINYSVIYKVEPTLLVKQNFNQLVQSFNNIYINAQRALEEVQDKYLQVTLSRRDGCLEILVSDTGIGILPENKKNIFSAYFTTSGGSGIGLAHVTQVLETMGGKIELTEELNFSTTFKLTFPLSCDTPS